MGGKEQTNPLGGLFDNIPGFDALSGAKENPELDKMKPALEKLKKQVDVQKLRNAVEKGEELTIVEILNPLEKLFKEVECPEAGFTNPQQIEEKWLIMKEQIVNWLIEAKEKEARQPINEFINNVSNMTGFPETKEEAEGTMKKFKDILNPKKLLFGGIVAWLTKEAATAKAKGGLTSVWGDICETLASLLGGKDAEKIKVLTAEINKAVEDKNWDLAEKKANELLKEDEKNKTAKDTLALVEKEKKVLTTKQGKAPEIHKKKMVELKDIIELTSIPIVFKADDYKEILKSSPFNGDAEALKKVIIKGSKRNGGIWSLNENVIKNNEDLKDGKFKFSLFDYLVPTKKIENIIKSVNGIIQNNPYKPLADKTPNGLRKFLDAVRTGDGLETYTV